MSWEEIKKKMELSKPMAERVVSYSFDDSDAFTRHVMLIEEYGPHLREVDERMKDLRGTEYERAMTWKRNPRVKKYISMNADGHFIPIDMSCEKAIELLNHPYVQFLSETIPRINDLKKLRDGILWSNEWQQSYYYLAQCKQRGRFDIRELPSYKNGYRLVLEDINNIK